MKEYTEKDLFDTPDGKVEVEYMHQDQITTLYTSDSFKAIDLEMEGDATFYLILPNEGITPEDLISDSEVKLFLSGALENWPEQAECLAHLTIPKFDIAVETDLLPIMLDLGITGAMDPNKADFSPITNTDQTYISSAEHAARLMIDEQGCEAAAFTILEATATGVIEQPEEIEFIVDHPFLFLMAGVDSSPLMIGMINDPSDS